MSTSMSVIDFGAVGDGTTDDSLAFTDALASSATQIIVPPGTYLVDNVILPAGKRLEGAGPGQTTLKIVSGSTNDLLSAGSADSVAVIGMTLDCTGAMPPPPSPSSAPRSTGLFLSQCADALVVDVCVRNAPAHGLNLVNCPRAKVDRIFIEGSLDWAIRAKGNSSTFSNYSNIHTSHCNRGMMVEDCLLVTCSNISGNGNTSSTMWFDKANWCLASNIVDYDSTHGDSVVISGPSTGTWIMGVSAKNSGGHGASIASTPAGAPVDCHIVNGYFEAQGECLACITSQLEDIRRPSNCSIRNVHGRNPGTDKVSEAFAIVNATNCVITGSVVDTQGGMLYAARELDGLGSSDNNRFEIDNWVAGTAGYFSLASPTSTIVHTRLERGHLHKSDADYNWDPAIDARQISFDAAPLTANRNLTLAPSWPGDRVRVVRAASGSFALSVKQGSTTLKALAAAGDWAELYSDGTNWKLAASS